MKMMTAFDLTKPVKLNKYATERANVVWLWENTTDRFHRVYFDNFDAFCGYADKDRILIANFVNPAIMCLKAGKSEADLLLMRVEEWKIFSYWNGGVKEFKDFARKTHLDCYKESTQIEMVQKVKSRFELLSDEIPFAGEYAKFIPGFISLEQEQIAFIRWIARFAMAPDYYGDGLDDLTEDEYIAMRHYVANPLIVRGVWRVAIECLHDVDVKWTPLCSYNPDKPVNWVCIQTDKGYRLHSVWEYAEIQDAIRCLDLPKSEAPIKWSGNFSDGVFYLTKCYRTTIQLLCPPNITRSEDLLRIRTLYEERLQYQRPNDVVLNRYEIMLVNQAICGYKDWLLLLKFPELFPSVIESIQKGLPLRKFMIRELCDGIPINPEVRLGCALVDGETVNAYVGTISGQLQHAIEDGRSVQIGVSQDGFSIAKCRNDISVWLSENNQSRE